MSLRGLFITGTDTGVGKTFVASAIVRRLRDRKIRVGAYKPAVSGSTPGPDGPIWSDVEILYAALGGEYPREAICPQRFEAPLAPPVAAHREGREIDARLLIEGAGWWNDRVDVLIVEGAGGWLSPLADHLAVADVARELGFPIVIVARLSLGTINHTLLTIEAAQARNVPIAGIILNRAAPPGVKDLSEETNAVELARRTTVPILATIEHEAAADLLQVPALHRIDFAGLAGGRVR